LRGGERKPGAPCVIDIVIVVVVVVVVVVIDGDNDYDNKSTTAQTAPAALVRRSAGRTREPTSAGVRGRPQLAD
jgi:hypothetical protein